MAGLEGKLRKNKHLLDTIRTLNGLFDAADRQALRTALDKKDWSGVCRALHMSEKDTLKILEQGAIHARSAVSDPEILEAVKAQSLNG